MRSVRFWIPLVICLSVVGCVGAGTTATRPAHQPRAAGVLSVVVTPTTGPGLDELLKSSNASAAPPVTPTPVATPSPGATPAGPLSCVEQRMRALREGKLLPTNVCS
jgi:hypothetical protein